LKCVDTFQLWKSARRIMPLMWLFEQVLIERRKSLHLISFTAARGTGSALDTRAGTSVLLYALCRRTSKPRLMSGYVQ
jgi:hypothetical protein